MVVLFAGGRKWGWVCVGEGVFAGAKGVCLRQCVAGRGGGNEDGYLSERRFFVTFAMCKKRQKIWVSGSAIVC